MTPIRKLYLRIFLQTGVPYGIIMTLFDVFASDGFSLWKLLFSTIFFGLIMSLTLVGAQKSGLKKLGITEFSEENLKVEHEKTFTSDLSKQELIEHLRTTKWNGKLEVSGSGNIIILKSRASWRSWGEKVAVDIRETDNNETIIKATSKPSYFMTLVDYGKNLENILLIENDLKT